MLMALFISTVSYLLVYEDILWHANTHTHTHTTVATCACIQCVLYHRYY